ncbi:hypothetical protein DMZ48_10090 [Robertkochia solimangrovi]|nr:hypothetical protein DMZ48_10090 [Robertkochia solimangrovi]
MKGDFPEGINIFTDTLFIKGVFSKFINFIRLTAQKINYFQTFAVISKPVFLSVVIYRTIGT